MYFTRSKARTEHKAAGVLPFSIHEGAVLVLLGAEPCKTGPGGKVWRTMWRDFGGSREAADSDSAATAAREFAEETLGLFGTCAVNQAGVLAAAAAMEAQLRDQTQAVKVVHALKRGAYHFYCTQTPWVAPLMFRLASQQNAATGAVAGAEKTAFAWVPMKELLECVAVSHPRYFLDARALVCGGPGTPPAARCGMRRFQLHPCFATSLRMAQKCGLDELVSQAHELPLPPPPPLPPLTAPAASEPGESSAAAAVAAGLVMECEAMMEDAEGGVGRSQHATLQQDSLAYWVTQAEVGAALRASSAPPAGDSSAPGLPSGIFLPPPQQQQQQQQQQRGSQRGVSLGDRSSSSVPPSPRCSMQPEASGSSLGRASSVDTASSLRQHREAVAAAAVEQVVHQIEQNSRLRQRLSRKQRQKLRRQRRRAEEAAAAAAAAADKAAAEGRLSHSGSEAAQQQGSQQQQHWVASAPEGESTPTQQAAAPPHWVHAMRELRSAFQPHMRLRKRLRLIVGE